MKVELRYKKSKDEWFKLPGTVPVTQEMHETIKQMKSEGVEVNSLTREYWQMLIDKWKSNRALR